MTKDRPKLKRKGKWQNPEFEELLCEYEEHFITLNSQLSNFVTIEKKNTIYKNITNKVNAIGGQERSADNIKAK